SPATIPKSAKGWPTCIAAFAVLLRLEEEVGFVLAEEEGDLGAQGGVGGEVGVGVDQLEGDLSRSDDPLLVAAERCQLEVVAALLARVHEGALTAKLEVDLGELE